MPHCFLAPCRQIRVWMTNMQRASNLEIAQEIVIFMMMVL